MRNPRTRRAAVGALLAGAIVAVAAPAASADDRHHHADEGGHHRPRHGQQFDVQAHRGGVGLVVENTLPAFANALELGVSTLELDVQITEDGHAVVTHDRDLSPSKCVDTQPAFAGDPEFPYVPGRTYVKDLTLAQVRTIDCGSLRLPQFPDQVLSPGERMPTLPEVLDLVNAYRARGVTLNIETKVEAGAPEQTAPRDQFVDVVAQDVRDARLLHQVTIQSFDWGALMRMREVEPRLPIVALTNGQQFLQAGQPGASPWLGGLDIDDFTGSLQQRFVAAAASFDADAVSPVHGDPQSGTVADPGYVPFTTRELVRAAHRERMEVLPWTIDDPATMESLIDIGVDGIITDRPDVLRQVIAERGFRLPRAYEPPRG
jgi:glycerophosphoryl diester phosphodiesterase